jgi:hypothetical protein
MVVLSANSTVLLFLRPRHGERLKDLSWFILTYVGTLHRPHQEGIILHVDRG